MDTEMPGNRDGSGHFALYGGDGGNLWEGKNR